MRRIGCRARPRWSIGFSAQVALTYSVDPVRVVVHGYESGGSLAFAAALRNRQMIRAVAAVEAAPAGQPPESDPLDRFSVYMATAAKSARRSAGRTGSGGVSKSEDSHNRQKPGRCASQSQCG